MKCYSIIIKTAGRYPAALLAAALAFLICFRQFYLLPAEAEINSLRSQTASGQAKLLQLREFAGIYESSGSFMESRRKELHRLRSILPEQPDAAGASDILFRLAEKCGMKIMALKVREGVGLEKDAKRLPSAVLHLEMDGDYQGFLRFLRQLGKNGIFMEKCTLERSGVRLKIGAEAVIFGSGGAAQESSEPVPGRQNSQSQK